MRVVQVSPYDSRTMTPPTSQPVPHKTPLFVRRQRDAAYMRWRALVEQIITATGVRPQLLHLPEGVWVQHFAVNEEAAGAVVAELGRVDA